jgi:hypothetical protein
VGWGAGGTVYTHVSKCENNKIKVEKKKKILEAPCSNLVKTVGWTFK